MATGDNNNLAVRRYEKKFTALLKAVYDTKALFREAFGELQALDGVSDSENAFYVKTSDNAVVMNAYDTDEDCAFGDRSKGDSRFGEMTEVKYVDVAVPYAWTWAIHEGLDRFTVNNDLAAAEADRFELQAKAKIRAFNTHQAAYLADVAEITDVTIPETFDDDDILTVFDSLAAKYADLEVSEQLLAYVSPLIFNAVVNHPLNTTAKRGDADISANKTTYFKGFKVIETPSSYFDDEAGHCMYTACERIGNAFTGINTARSIDAIDFDGRELQGAGKAGEYIIPDNRAAVGVVSFT